MSEFRRSLPRASFDLAIVGGGVHGLFAALEAARRGWKVVLVERDDFGSGLSFNHQRTVHGGLRALQSGGIARTRQQVAERRAWAVMVPHLVRPLPFLLPTGGGLMRSRAVIGTALRLYEWLGAGKNQGLPPALQLPPARLVSRREALARFPGLDDAGVTGAAVWYDYQLRHPDRFNWVLASAAIRAGASLLNYVEAIEPLRVGSRLAGLRVRDALSGIEGELHASRVLLCAGAGSASLFERWQLGAFPPLVRACNVLLNRPAHDTALAARGRSGRMLTATPWDGLWLVGTFQTDEPAAPAAAVPSRADVEAMLDDANSAFPSLKATLDDVRLVHAGLTPATWRRGRAELLPESSVRVHGGGLYSIVGVKFTTARLTALDALDRIGLGPQRHAPRTGRVPQPLPHGSADGAAERLAEACRSVGVSLDPDVHAHLLDWYGTEAADVVRFSAAAARLQRLSAGLPLLEGELIYAVEQARACRLADVVLRRTHLGTTGDPGHGALDRAADILATHLSWSAERRDEEVRLTRLRWAV